MSPVDYKTIKLNRNEARKRIAEIVTQHPGRVNFTGHALKALADDGLATPDGWNVLKSPSSKIVDEGELKDGSWRYRLGTTNMVVVLAFEPDGYGLNVITCWDKRKRGSK